MRLNLSDEPITAELLSEALERTGQARIAVNGTSMHPTLQMGWWVYVERARGEDLKPGSIAIFRGERYLTVHRLVWVERRAAGTTLLFRGDYNRERERVPASAVMGRVVAIEIQGAVRGAERIVSLAPDALFLFYRGCYTGYSLLRPILPEPAPPGTPPGPAGRLARRALRTAERFLSLFLPHHR